MTERRSSPPAPVVCLLLTAAFVGCTSPSPHAETVAPSAMPATASASDAAIPPALSATATQVASATPPASAAPSASAAVADDALPKVEVKFYGLHVGGGKNDKAEHAPIISSVNAHLDDFKRCFAKADDPKKGGTFGVQLLIPGEGGKADVSRPKSSVKGDAFKDCMMAAYQAMDFEKPKGGVKTNATYSLIFTPDK